MEPDRNDEAFCPLLWSANGGRVTASGKPIFDGSPISGSCSQPGDCYRCELMQNVLTSLATQGFTTLWICPSCAGEVKKIGEEQGIITKLPGFFAEGFCQRSNCHRVEQWGPEGGYSTVLQLLTVIGAVIP